MTEAEWLSCTDPQTLLAFLQRAGEVSDRKARLLIVAICRRVRHLLVHPESQRCVEVAERYADGLGSAVEVAAARQAAESQLADAWHGPFARWHEASAASAADWACWLDEPGEPAEIAWCAGEASEIAARGVADEKVYIGSPYVTFAEGPDRQEQAHHADLVRDIFGPFVFRPVALDPAWRTATVVGLARGIYADRRFEDLAVFADALEEAGCDNTEILNHCRQSSIHVKGCWVLDLCLGKG